MNCVRAGRHEANTCINCAITPCYALALPAKADVVPQPATPKEDNRVADRQAATHPVYLIRAGLRMDFVG